MTKGIRLRKGGFALDPRMTFLPGGCSSSCKNFTTGQPKGSWSWRADLSSAKVLSSPKMSFCGPRSQGLLGQGVVCFQGRTSAPCDLLCGSFTVWAKRRPNTKLPPAIRSAGHPGGASSTAEEMAVQLPVWCGYLHLEEAIYLSGSCCQDFTLLHLDRSGLDLPTARASCFHRARPWAWRCWLKA